MSEDSFEKASNQSVENNINEYYRLKSKYDNDNEKNKKKILNNKMLDMKEKKAEFKQLKPKCVNCGRPGGTTFASIVSKDSMGAKFRELRAFCKATEPCGLNINIAVGNFENINDILKMIDGEIYTAKNEIINDKNKLLFGLTTTEKALGNFDLQKATIKDFTDLLETYLQIHIKLTDDPETKAKLNEEVEKSYLLIQQIRAAIKNFNETNSIEFVRGGVEVYNDQLRPVLNEILKLKYKENMVVFEESSNTYHLVQRAYSIKDLEMNNDKYETLVFDTSVQAPGGLKKRKLVVDTSSTESIDTLSTDTTADIIGKPTIDEADGTVTWSNRNYQTLWNKMNNELKTGLLSDTEWMQEFMDNCVRARLQSKSCEFTNPSNLIIPPQLVEDGMYDFGNTVYNNIFNKFDESYKNTLLSLFSTNPEDGVKNYSMMENTLADIVKKELKFNRGNF
jgi:hypothetical protein